MRFSSCFLLLSSSSGCLPGAAKPVLFGTDGGQMVTNKDRAIMAFYFLSIRTDVQVLIPAMAPGVRRWNIRVGLGLLWEFWGSLLLPFFRGIPELIFGR